MTSTLRPSTGLRCGVSLLALALLAAPALAQPQQLKVLREKVEVGFRGYGQDRPMLCKTGMWAPVYVTFFAGPDGEFRLPLGPDGAARATLAVQTPDSDRDQAVYARDFDIRDSQRSTVLTYMKPADTAPEFQLRIVDEKGKDFSFPGDRALALGLQSHLYLTVGAKMPDLQAALVSLAGVGKVQGGFENPAPEGAPDDTGVRHAAVELDPTRLPDQWFGYDAVDLLVLTTGSKPFLQGLRPDRVKAIAGWVRQGGRLLVSVAPDKQDLVANLLNGPAWQPPLPAKLFRPVDEKPVRLAHLNSLQNFAGQAAHDRPFPIPADDKDRKLALPRLEAGKDVEVLIQEETGEVLMVRVPYGRGSVTLLALDLGTAPFTTWKGGVDFWKELVRRLAPQAHPGADPGMNPRRGWGNEDVSNDVTARLHRELDNFDVPVISFGWVALFILLYILVVGPLDYLILKKVFHRLEWTWITFPSVVVLVSVVAYFTAYALKGSDLKVNKVDLIDIDLRTQLDEQYRPKNAYAFGTSWFALLSPRIQSYTLGVEPVQWAGGGFDKVAGGPVTMSWLGRTDSEFRGVGGRSSGVLGGHSYRFAPDATGIEGVPIPVWTTRAFTASWEGPLPQMPFTVDLHYAADDPDQRVGGTLKNNLAVDLVDVHIFYNGKAYTLDGPLTGGKAGGAPVNVSLDLDRKVAAGRWLTADFQEPMPSDGRRQTTYNPGPTVKEMFFEELVSQGSERNHSFRRLDQSWRVHELPQNDKNVREAVLVGRFARAEGRAETLSASGDARLPSLLWLGKLPSQGGERPALSGTLIQDTFVRVFLPVRPN